MKIITGLIIAVGLFIIGLIYDRWDKEQKRKQKELEEKLAREREAERQHLFDFCTSKLDSIKIAVDQFAKHLDFQNGYFANYPLTVWTYQYTELFNEIKDKTYEKIELKDTEVKTIKTFQDYFKNAKTYRNDYNKQFVKEELESYNLFFDNIEGRKLDTQQRTAVVTDDDNNIVIAGAGSGKTTTTIGKVNYVIDRYKVEPSEILLISFTRKSAQDLKSRINIDGVEAKTFHKFGKDVIVEVEGKQPSIFDESQFRPLLTRYFNELIQNENYLQKVTTYFTDFLKPVKAQSEFENQGDYIQYIKDQNFRTYKLKEVPVRGRMTYKMEVVKSIEECKIANFLLFNSIDYKYEEQYEIETVDMDRRQYKPDFSIYQNGTRIYLEHFGITTRDGDIPQWFTKDGQTYEEAKREYNSKIDWARNLHQEHGTTIIETFSYEMAEDTLFENLTENLTEAGIILTPKTPQEIWEIIKNAAEDEVHSFITLFQTFITLMKSNNYTIDDLLTRNDDTEDSFHRKRNKLFMEIIQPIYERYENHLREKRPIPEIDFNDMINKATTYLTNSKYNKKFKYVIIDEFQDISIGRYKLVKAIRNNNPACKLFCVGDDWQSIYRFSGSDIALFKEFEKHFGYTVKSKIETTYRFHNPLINLSSEFIQKNPNQAKKELTGTTNSRNTNYQIRYSVSENQDDTNSLKEIFDELTETNENIEVKNIFILGRYNFDIERINSNNEISVVVREIHSNNEIVNEYAYQKGKCKRLRENEKIFVKYKKHIDNAEYINCEAEYLTVHKAKGLEADIVIIINCNSGKHGFPSEMSDDNVLNLLLSEADQYENGEERRLFYVAMTRAKENVFFVADSSYKSKFIAELEIESESLSIKKCPRCITADLVKKSGTSNGRQWAFYGCTNFLYGCDYQEWVN